MCCATFPLIFVGGVGHNDESGNGSPIGQTRTVTIYFVPTQHLVVGAVEFVCRTWTSTASGASCGFFSLVICISTFFISSSNQPKRLRPFSVAVLSRIYFARTRSWMRVRYDARQIALLHGCTGPVVFAMTMFFVECCSQRWLSV